MSQAVGSPSIRNDRQRRITQARVRDFETALQQLSKEPLDLDPRLIEAVAAGYRDRIARLKAELAEYDAFKTGAVDSVRVTDIASLGGALIGARLARNWTQADLAHALGVSAQQVQRWEATAYRSAKLSSIGATANALGIRLDASVALAPATATP